MPEQTTQLQTLTDADNGWLVWSIEHTAWWRSNSCGYTTCLEDAGRYTFDLARDICRDANYRAGSGNARLGIPSEVMVPSPELQAALPALVSDYMRLRGIVSKLPVTKDGISVVPGEDEVWRVNHSGVATSYAIETSLPECCEWPCVLISEVGKCYSTEAAALASQQEGVQR